MDSFGGGGGSFGGGGYMQEGGGFGSPMTDSQEKKVSDKTLEKYPDDLKLNWFCV